MGLNISPFFGPQCHMTKRICRNGGQQQLAVMRDTPPKSLLSLHRKEQLAGWHGGWHDVVGI
jgi:hypothetical protein